MPFIPWTEITQFANIRKFIKAYPEICQNTKVTYKGKVKLHGTNAAIQCLTNDILVAQSRESILTVEKDNFGFARFVDSNKDKLNKINEKFGDVILFGEWCGKGIQNGVACSDIPTKSFFVFAAGKIKEDKVSEFVVEPEELSKMVEGIKDFYVIPWHCEVEVDYSQSDEELQAKVDELNVLVKQVEECDPLIKQLFNVSGVGEGLVLAPVSKDHLGYDNYKNLVFKAKGEKHQVKKVKAAVQVSVDQVANIKEFIDMFVTEQRLEQGVSVVCEGKFEQKFIGSFVQWMTRDVEKESKDELEKSGMKYSDVSKEVVNTSKKWYLSKLGK